MKYLVTGGAGYVGGVCATVLLERGHEVVVLDDLSTGNREGVPAGAEFVEGDVAELAAEVLEPSFDGVLHFAARSLVGESVEKPELYWQGNVVTTLTLLEAMRAAGVGNLVFSSTAATYGEPETVPITEDLVAVAERDLQDQRDEVGLDRAVLPGVAVGAGDVEVPQAGGGEPIGDAV